MSDRVKELRGKASASRQKAEEARASQVANTTQNKVLDTLTKLQNAGRISGFHVRRNGSSLSDDELTLHSPRDVWAVSEPFPTATTSLCPLPVVP